MKLYYPAVACEEGNLLVGLLGSFDNKADAELALRQNGPITGLLFGMNPPPKAKRIFEHEGPITPSEAVEKRWPQSQIGGTNNFIVEGPLQRQYAGDVEEAEDKELARDAG